MERYARGAWASVSDVLCGTKIPPHLHSPFGFIGLRSPSIYALHSPGPLSLGFRDCEGNFTPPFMSHDSLPFRLRPLPHPHQTYFIVTNFPNLCSRDSKH